MKRWLWLVPYLVISLGLPLAIAGSSTYVVRDGNGSLLTFGDTTDGSGNLYANAALVDGSNAGLKATVTAGNALKVDGSAATQPVSAASLPLPTGAATAAKQPAIGTAGAPSADVLTVQGSAAGTALPVSGTLGVSGNVTVVQPTGTSLHTVCDSGCSSSTAPADASAFTAGTTPQSPVGGFFQTTPTLNALTTGQMGAFQVTANRALFTNLRNSSGTELATSGAPLRTDPTGTTTQPVSIAGNQAVNLAQVGGTTAVTGGVAGSQGVGGLAASGAAVVGNPILNGCRAQSAEPTAVTNGQAVDNACDLTGKQLVMPYSNKENFLAGENSSTATAAVTLIAAQGVGVKIYVTAIQCYNSGATTSTIVLNNTQADTHNWTGVNVAGGGFNTSFPTPLVVAANTALTFTPGSASTTQFCNVQGYSGS